MINVPSPDPVCGLHTHMRVRTPARTLLPVSHQSAWRKSLSYADARMRELRGRARVGRFIFDEVFSKARDCC